MEPEPEEDPDDSFEENYGLGGMQDEEAMARKDAVLKDGMMTYTVTQVHRKTPYILNIARCMEPEFCVFVFCVVIGTVTPRSQS